ncbi:MAG: ATP-binding protein [Anaerolineae bacterium]|nr:ATP-binding protein [Anaerolineae bacterium]
MSNMPETIVDEIQPRAWEPRLIDAIEETGLTIGFVSDMALKILYLRGQSTGYDIATQMRLPFQSVLNPALEFLKREQLCEVRGTTAGVLASSYQFIITNKGMARARELMERTAYTGAAPVPWEDYVQAIKAQERKRLTVSPQLMRKALAHMVLNEKIFAKIGPAVNSGKSIFLYGPPGNGKTTIAESIGRLILGDDMYIPYAVEADGQIIKVYDEINHNPVKVDTTRGGTGGLSSSRRDGRWIKIRRPVIMVGGELTLDGLELKHDPINKFYEAPFQMKANGGMFLIDDFGRQQVRPRDLLNRWVVPMEKNVDFLGLHTGRKLEVPFSLLLVFSTNLPPRDLVDEAFLRRIRHKIEITSPSFDEFREIFQRMCQRRQVTFDEQAIRYLLQEYYIKKNRPLRANHPRDIIDQLIDVATYLEVEPTMSKEMIDHAAESYFVDL